MILRGTFKDINDNTITVVIYNKIVEDQDIDIDTSDDIRFTGDPIDIKMNVDDLFEPVITRQCTIHLLSKSYLGNILYAPNAESVVVNILRNDECIFAGYVTPASYNQNFSHDWEVVDVNCIDMLGSLKYKYLTDNKPYETLVIENSVSSFKEFIDKCGITGSEISVVNFPVAQQENEMIVTGWTKNDAGDYVAVKTVVGVLDASTGMNNGEIQTNDVLTTSIVQGPNDDLAVVDGQNYYKNYTYVEINGQQVNTGDWTVGNIAPNPTVTGTTSEVDGFVWQDFPPFTYYEHESVYYTMSDGTISVNATDALGEQIPEEPSETTAGSYWYYEQSGDDDLYYDEQTGKYYYKEYAVVHCLDEDEKIDRDWIVGPEKI